MERQSQEALDLLTTSDEIVSSIETHGVEVAALLEEKWTTMNAPPDSAPQVDAPKTPDYLGHLLSLRDGLNTSADALGVADRVHVHHLGELIQLREDREGLTETAYEKFSTMRRTIDELIGEGKAFVLAGIEGPTARTTRKLLRQMDLALPRLNAPQLKFNQVKIAGVTVDPAAMGRDLQSVADKLRVTNADFQRARRVAQASRKEKNRRIAEHRNTTTWTARIVEGYYQLAGETELAERLRPTVVRQSRPPAPPEELPTTIPEESAPAVPAPDVTPPAPPTPDETAPEGRAEEGLTLQALRASLRASPTAAEA